MKILIAEDEAVPRKALQRTLEKWGHQVVAASDGSKGWNVFQTDHFDMVISDWMMPIMDGLELVERIRAKVGHGYVYIVLLTAKSMKEDLVAGIEAGADDFITKPFDQSELRARLRAGQRIVELEQDLANRNDELEEANRLVAQINEKMRRDLDAAARIQEALLPKMLPEVPGIRFAWDFRPCEQLAGDILNIFRLDEDHVALYVLDVSNHGVPAAFLAVTLSRVLSPLMTQSMLLKQPSGEPQGYRLAAPAEVAHQLNRQFPMNLETGQYFTLLYGVLNTKTRQFRYVQAGHPNPIYISVRHKSAIVLENEGLPIGMMADTIYEEHTVNMAGGDRLYLYSDGIPEALNEKDEQFGEDRLREALIQSGRMPLGRSLNFVTARIIEWCGRAGPSDDLSLLGLEVSKPGLGRLSGGQPSVR